MNRDVPNTPIWESWESTLLKTIALGHMVIDAARKNPEEAATRIAVVPRGGLYVVNILSRMLGMSGDKVLSLGISKYDRNHPTHAGEFKIGQLPTRKHIEGQRVLLADEVHDTGETTGKAIHILYDLGATSVKTAVIHYKPGMNKRGMAPDFFVEETNGWVHYPWEVIDPQGTLYLDAMENGYSHVQS